MEYGNGPEKAWGPKESNTYLELGHALLNSDKHWKPEDHNGMGSKDKEISGTYPDREG